MANSKALNIKIPEELYDALKQKAEENNVSMGAIVRIACSEYLKKEQK